MRIIKLRIILPETSAYVKSRDGESKWMYYLIEDDNLLKKYNEIWNKVSNIIKKNLIAKPTTQSSSKELTTSCGGAKGKPAIIGNCKTSWGSFM